MSFATPADFKLRYDNRLMGMLVRDDGTKATPNDLLTDTVIQTCLDDAAGDIVAACIVGNKYSESDLNGIITAGGASAAHLKRINCDAAIRYLADRRVYTKVNETLEKIMDRAMTYLKDLRDGQAMFDVQTNVQASVPTVAGPTTMTLQNLQTIRRRTQHLYPTETLPYNR
jgi:phage gp36-like protein